MKAAARDEAAAKATQGEGGRKHRAMTTVRAEQDLSARPQKLQWWYQCRRGAKTTVRAEQDLSARPQKSQWWSLRRCGAMTAVLAEQDLSARPRKLQWWD